MLIQNELCFNFIHLMNWMMSKDGLSLPSHGPVSHSSGSKDGDEWAP